MEQEDRLLLANVSRHLEGAVELARKISQLVYEFRDDGPAQEQLDSSLHEYVETLSKLDRAAQEPACRKIHIPTSLIDEMDQGRHPDYWFRDLLRELQTQNGLVVGKQQALAGLRDALAQRLGALAAERGWPEAGRFAAPTKTATLHPPPPAPAAASPNSPSEGDEPIDIQL